uniref:Ig-like domain-containing protein n=1 Tax=Electrophorus electricus TaxID=8005 RepID=A0A4W4GE60_ELEEL
MKVSVEVIPNSPQISSKDHMSLWASLGQSVQMKCDATGEPVPTIIWISPNNEIITSSSVKYQILNDGTLIIKKVTLADQGKYACVARNSAVPSDKGVYRCLAKNVAGQAEKRYALEPGKKPQIRSTASSMKISLGQTLSMPCTVDGWPQATITWTLPNGLVLDRPQVIGRVTYLSNGTLHLREIAKFDRGTYTCKATNMFGSSSLSYPVTIMVFPPQITNPPPSIIRVAKGSPVTLNCIAAGIPKPDISWTLPGRTTLVPNNRFTALGGIHMTKDGSLVIQDPSLMNSGIYKCNAKNALDSMHFHSEQNSLSLSDIVLISAPKMRHKRPVLQTD